MAPRKSPPSARPRAPKASLLANPSLPGLPPVKVFSWTDFLLLGAGGVLIFEPTHLSLTLLGAFFWALAVLRVSRKVKDGTGAPLFSSQPMRGHHPNPPPSAWVPAFLAYSLVILVPWLLALQAQGKWIFSFVILLSIALVIGRLEKTQDAFEISPKSEGTGRPGWAMAPLLAVGVFFIFYKFGVLPCWTDNDCANCLHDAMGFYHGDIKTPFRTGWGDNPSLPYLLYAGAFRLFGISFTSAALVSSLAHLASLFYFYAFCRILLPKGPALLAGVLFACSRWLLFFVRTPREASLLPLFEAACLYHFVRAVETGRKRDYAWFGIFLALLMHTYLPARGVLAFFLSMILVLALFFGRNFRAELPRWGLAFGTFLLFMAPLIHWYASYPHILLDRMKTISIFSVVREAGNWDPLWLNLARSLKMIHLEGGNDDHYNLASVPMMDPLAGLCFWVGLGWVLLRVTRFPFLFLFSGLVLGFLGVVLARDFGHPMRGITMVPFVMVLAAWGADRLARAACCLLPEARKLLYPLLMTLVAFSALAFNFNVFFERMPRDKDFMKTNDEYNFKAGEALVKYPQGWDAYIDFDAAMSGKYATYKRADLGYWFPDTLLPLNKVPKSGAVVCLDGIGAVLEDAMKVYYPNAKSFPVSFYNGGQALWFWELTPKEVEEGRNRPPVNELFGIWIEPSPTGGKTLPARWWPAPFGLVKWAKEWNLSSDRYFLDFIWRGSSDPFLVRVDGQVRVFVNGGLKQTLDSGGELKALSLAGFPNGSQVRLEYRPGKWGPHFDLFRVEGEVWRPVPSGHFLPPPRTPGRFLLTHGQPVAMGHVFWPDWPQ